jgi:hypothetical protein
MNIVEFQNIVRATHVCTMIIDIYLHVTYSYLFIAKIR